MKKIIKVLSFVLFICLIVPKVVYAETIHLTKEDFDNAYEHRGRTIPEYEGDVWVPEQEGPEEWVEGHCTEEGEWIEEEPGVGYCTVGEWVDGHYEPTIIEGHNEFQVIPEHYEAGEKIKGILAEEEFDGDNYIIKYNLDSNTYILDEDIIFSYDYEDKIISKIVMNSVTVELDLNGHKFSAGIFSYSPVEVTNSTLHIYGNGAIYGDEMGLEAFDSELVIDNGRFNDFTFDGGNLTINNGYFVNYYSKRYFSGDSNVTINNGNFFSADHGLLLIDEDVDLTINHGSFYGLYTGLAALNNTNIKIYDGNFYGFSYGAILSTQASTFELQKAFFSANEDTVMNGILDTFDSIISERYEDRENFIQILNYIRNNRCPKVGGIGIIMGSNSDVVLDDYLHENFVLSQPLTFTTEDTTYISELYNVTEARIRYSQEDEFQIISNYLVIEGANQTYKQLPITMRANGEFDIFEKMVIDGVEIDPDQYTVQRGSTIVTISNDYLQTLSSGVHNVSFVYINGSASTSLTVPRTNNPQTADSILTYIFMFMVSIFGYCFVFKKHI